MSTATARAPFLDATSFAVAQVAQPSAAMRLGVPARSPFLSVYESNDGEALPMDEADEQAGEDQTWHDAALEGRNEEDAEAPPPDDAFEAADETFSAAEAQGLATMFEHDAPMGAEVLEPSLREAVVATAQDEAQPWDGES